VVLGGVCRLDADHHDADVVSASVSQGRDQQLFAGLTAGAGSEDDVARLLIRDDVPYSIASEDDVRIRGSELMLFCVRLAGDVALHGAISERASDSQDT